MITVDKLSFTYTDRLIYNKISFSISEGEHCALIGSNGTGKTTLIKLLLNSEEYIYDGKIDFSDNYTTGYVKQFFESYDEDEKTVFDYLSEEFVSMQKKINDLCVRMTASDNLEELLMEYQVLLDNFDAKDGNNYENNIRKELRTAGLSELENKSLGKLSGGELKLVEIIKQMMLRPHLLIMDEPDAFLDFTRQNSLKELINSYKGSVLIVTHNRFLLNHCFNKILHLENTDILEFEGSYIEYKLELLRKKIELSKLSVKDTNEIERNKKLVEKMTNNATSFANASLGRSLKARKSIVQRLEARRIKAPFVDIKHPKISFATDMDKADAQVSFSGSIGYEKVLISDIDIELMPGEKAVLIGPNGTGKTTLLKKIYNQIQNNENDGMTKADYVSLTDSSFINSDKTVREILYDSEIHKEEAINKFLNDYCLTESILDVKLGKLSGGEKNLLQIGLLSLRHSQILLLDEPTCHLDIYAQQELERAIKEFNGTVLMVSHDFYTIVNSMDYVYCVEDGLLRKMSTRKFRKLIYEKYFDKNYLEYEKAVGELELKTTLELERMNYEKAEEYADKLCEVIDSFKK